MRRLAAGEFYLSSGRITDAATSSKHQACAVDVLKTLDWITAADPFTKEIRRARDGNSDVSAREFALPEVKFMAKIWFDLKFKVNSPSSRDLSVGFRHGYYFCEF